MIGPVDRAVGNHGIALWINLCTNTVPTRCRQQRRARAARVRHAWACL